MLKKVKFKDVISEYKKNFKKIVFLTVLLFIFKILCLFISLLFIFQVVLVAFIGIMILNFGYQFCLINIMKNKKISYLDIVKVGYKNLERLFVIQFKILKKNKKFFIIIAIITISIFLISILALYIPIMLQVIGMEIDDNSIFYNFYGICSVLYQILFLFTIAYLYIKKTKYSLSNFVLITYPNLSNDKIVEKSEKLLKNKQKNYLKINSILMLLTIITFVIVIICYKSIIPVNESKNDLFSGLLGAIALIISPILYFLIYNIGGLLIFPFANISKILFFENLDKKNLKLLKKN